MGSTLTNGIYLPAEGERNCYTGLAANWTALDSPIGGYNAHIGNATIHVTAEDKQAWNGKADASALTAHTGDTTIHVTAADKNTWDAVTGKANDADVVHKSGSETIAGTKTFSEDIVISNSDTSQNSKRLVIRSSKVNLGDSNSDSWGISFNAGASYAALINSEKSPNSMQGLSLTVRTKDGNNNLISANYRLRVYTDGSAYLIPGETDSISLGSSSNKWKDTCTNLINNLEPSSLSLPSGIDSRIDISSYFTNTGTAQSNRYTVPANGYIYLTLSELTNVHCFSRTSGNVTNYAQTFTKLSNSTGTLYVLFPVRKNDVFVATWYTTTTVSVDGAFFIPCQGNV